MLRAFVRFTLVATICACQCLSSCAPWREFVPEPSATDRDLEGASIEDYILSLPKFMVHEETVAEFRSRVERARARPENTGKPADYLYVPGDGTWPSKIFRLDREQATLTMRVLDWELGQKDRTVVMRRVAGGWQREDR